MNLKEHLAAGHNKTLTEATVRFVGPDEKRFKELLTFFFGPDKVLAQRAAWAFSEIAIAYPEFIAPTFRKLMEQLNAPDNHNAIERNILRAFQSSEVPEEYEAVLVDHCFARIKNESVAVAIRAFAITVAAKICKKYPELANELQLLFKEIMLVEQTPAIKVRVRDALRDLGK